MSQSQHRVQARMSTGASTSLCISVAWTDLVSSDESSCTHPTLCTLTSALRYRNGPTLKTKHRRAVLSTNVTLLSQCLHRSRSFDFKLRENFPDGAVLGASQIESPIRIRCSVCRIPSPSGDDSCCSPPGWSYSTSQSGFVQKVSRSQKASRDPPSFGL